MAVTNGYCTLAEVKAALRITDNIDDTLLENAVEAASRRIDGECSRRFYIDATTSARTYAANRSAFVFIDDVATLTGLVVKVDDTFSGSYSKTLTAGTDYQTEPTNAAAQTEPVTMLRALNAGFPVEGNGRALIEVTAKWGWPAIPDAIREATVLLAARQFKRLDSPLGVAGFGDLGAIVVRRIDPDVAAMVAPFKTFVVA
jgi:hypothetical protein